MALQFLQDEDYQDSITKESLSKLLDSRPSALFTAEKKAIGQLQQYCANKLDLTKILQQKKEARDDYIIMLLVDLSLYHLYTASAPHQIPEHRSQRYEDAINWLKDVGRGKITPYLSTKSKTHEDIIISSEKRDRNFF